MALKDVINNSLKGTTEDIKGQINQISEKEKSLLTGYEKKIDLIDYETSKVPELLNAKQLSDDIRLIDKKNAEALIVKCQRLYLITKHKLYKDLGYQNSEEFALSEHNIKRIQLYKYVFIFEKLERKLLNTFKNVQSTKHLEDLSIEKLYIIAKLEEENKINEWFEKILQDNMSVTELKKELVEDNLLINRNFGKNKDDNFESEISRFIKKIPKRKLTLEEIDAIDELIKKLIFLKNS